MNRFERGILWASLAATTVTGVVYGWMKYLLTSDDPFAVANHPWQPAMLKAHIASAPFLVFAIGMAAAGHVGRHWKSGRPDGRRSGLGLLAVAAPMIVSGYLVQIVTHRGWLVWIVGAHLVTGFGYAAMLGAHRWSRARRSRSPTVRDPGMESPR